VRIDPKRINIAGSVAEQQEVRAAQYVRMSTEEQCYSTQNQMAAIARYADSHRMRVVRTFSDEGRSGISLKGRSGLLSLLAVVQSGAADFSAILVYDVSRWGRFQDIDESVYWDYVCKRAGVEIHYCAEPFLNDRSLSSLILKSLKRTMAGEYSRELSTKVFVGQCRLVELGYHQGGPIGFGYRRMLVDQNNQPQGMLTKGQRKWLPTGRVVPVPGPEEEQAIVREIYHSFVECGKGRTEIARELNARGIASETGRPWTFYTVHQILANPKYIGANVFNRTSCKLQTRHIDNPKELWIRKDRAFEALVTEECFSQAAKLLKQRTPTDDEMLDRLRSLLATQGHLSESILNEKHIPISSYGLRFGGLLKAYARIGFSPKHDYSYLDSQLREHCKRYLNEIASGLERNGAVVTVDSNSSMISINGGVRVCWCLATYHNRGLYPWRVRLKTLRNCDLALIGRMNQTNTSILDYYLLPGEVLPHKSKLLHLKNGCRFDRYRFDNLDYLYHVSQRKRVGD
jgi:DNA invertase Pin-like site-specific DNA recombinase